MQKNLEVAKKIFENINSKETFILLQEINIHKIFEKLFRQDITSRERNVIICFIIYAYDNDSLWLNLKQNRYDNKLKIFKSLTDDIESDSYRGMLDNTNDLINDIIIRYVEDQTTWKWTQITSYLDFHSNMIRFASKKTETEKSIDKLIGKGDDQKVETLTSDYDMDTIAKVNKQKGDLLDQALSARQKADTLLAEIKNEFVQLDHAIQQDFGFQPTDEKRLNTDHWRDFIKEDYLPKKKAGLYP